MHDAITDVEGIEVGHAQDFRAGTGCTVVLARSGAVPGVDVRGGAPGTRETDSLQPENLIEAAHAVYLGGGSAFGLAGATGVMQYLEEQGVGLDVGVTRVPIVPGAVIFDLAVGDWRVRPDAAMGLTACRAATRGPVAQGSVGAGTGASIGSKGRPKQLVKGGVGTASACAGELVVGAIVVVNCFGDIVDPATGEVIAGMMNSTRDGLMGAMAFLRTLRPGESVLSDNTTIGVVATNAGLTKAQARRVAIMAHDGFARAIVPVHTMSDGDSVFCLATGAVAADTTLVGALASDVMARAIVSAVRHAEPLFGLPALRDLDRAGKR